MADKLTRRAASDALPTWRFLLQRMHLTVRAADAAAAFAFVAYMSTYSWPDSRITSAITESVTARST